MNDDSHEVGALTTTSLRTGAAGPEPGAARRPLVKICGLTRWDDVRLARDLGAWAVGFVFAPSPRRLTPAEARRLVERLGGAGGAHTGCGPLSVGVFVDETEDEIARVVAEVGLDAVQLHGTAGPGGNGVRAAVAARDRAAGARRDHPVVIIQAVPVVVPAVGSVPPAGSGARSREIPGGGVSGGPGAAADGADRGALCAAVARAREEADVVLLDTSAGGRFGGTGTGFPWGLAREAGDGAPLLVAGGIGPDTAVEVLRKSGAWGIDVSSGVESSPGVKDPPSLRRLFARIQEGMEE